MAKEQKKEMPVDYIADKGDREKFKKPITGGERLATAELISTIVDVIKKNSNFANEEKERLLDLVAYEDYVNFLLNNGSFFSDLEEKSVKEYGSLRKEYTGSSLPKSTLEERETMYDKLTLLMESADEAIQDYPEVNDWYTDNKSNTKLMKLGLEILKEHLTNNESCKEHIRVRDQIAFLIGSLLKYGEPYEELKNFEKQLKSEGYIMDDFYYETAALLRKREETDVNISKKEKNRIIAEREKIALHIQVND